MDILVSLLVILKKIIAAAAGDVPDNVPNSTQRDCSRIAYCWIALPRRIQNLSVTPEGIPGCIGAGATGFAVAFFLAFLSAFLVALS
jgi:hypothetical protein